MPDKLTVADFRQSLSNDAPPAGLGRALQSLWYEAKGDWEKAHRLAQDEETPAGAWVHAYLHRVEGDQNNAAYWYRRAGQPVSNASLAEEWESLVRALLA
ncbi:MAG TPA: hypothetical protein VNK95_18415 [Caldilineaceae bacterium]|nr:hypothetical protein [Caldilineaceae bacterium]